MSKVQLEGKFIEESEDGLVTIEVDRYGVLGDLDNDDIEKYALEWCGLFKDASEIDIDNLISEIEYRGYEVSEKENLPELDIIDARMLGEIVEKFYNASVFEREGIYKQITK